mgnify:CR=1
MTKAPTKSVQSISLQKTQLRFLTCGSVDD